MKTRTLIAIVGGVLAVAILLVAVGVIATRSNKTTVDATASPTAAPGALTTTASSAPTAAGQLTLAGISGAVKVGDGAKLNLQYTGNAADVSNTVLALNGAPAQVPTGFVGQFNIETPIPGSIAAQASVKLKDGTLVQSNTISITVADAPAAPTSTAATTIVQAIDGWVHRVTTDQLTQRSAPRTNASVAGPLLYQGQTVNIVCQTKGEIHGEGLDGTGVTDYWDRLDNGSYVADWYVDTAKPAISEEGKMTVTGHDPAIPLC